MKRQRRTKTYNGKHFMEVIPNYYHLGSDRIRFFQCAWCGYSCKYQVLGRFQVITWAYAGITKPVCKNNIRPWYWWLGEKRKDGIRK